ncbi:hypothetical protein N0V85_005473 [Neurospora sp. IMI 360204]|nr:hypothetical protein N0V85_005473 [Neurospora sp. IMI 360204]
MYGIAEPLESVLQQTKFRCPNGECPFKGDFETLAVCSSCMNLTDKLLIKKVDPDKQLNISLSHSKGARSVVTRRGDPIVQYSLPNDLYLDNSISMTMKGTANPAEVITQDRLDWQQKAMPFPTPGPVNLLGETLLPDSIPAVTSHEDKVRGVLRFNELIIRVDDDDEDDEDSGEDRNEDQGEDDSDEESDEDEEDQKTTGTALFVSSRTRVNFSRRFHI